MTYNDNIKIFHDISYHVELEEKCREAAKSSGQLYMTESHVLKGVNTERKTRNNDERKDNDSKNPQKHGTKSLRKKTRCGRAKRETRANSNVISVIRLDTLLMNVTSRKKRYPFLILQRIMFCF